MAKIAAGDRLKHTIKDLEDDQAVSGKLVENVLGLTTGLATGYLTKKITVGSKGNLLRRFLGASIQLGVTTFVAQHPKVIKSSVLYILKYIRRKTK